MRTGELPTLSAAASVNKQVKQHNMTAAQRLEAVYLPKVVSIFNGFEVQDKTGDKDYYKPDIDFLVRRGAGLAWRSIDFKFDTTDWGNLFHEVVSSDRGASKNLGWGLTATHDLLGYTFVETGEMLLLHANALRRIVRQQYASYRSSCANNGHYLSFGMLVPVRDLVHLMPPDTCFRIDVRKDLEQEAYKPFLAKGLPFVSVAEAVARLEHAVVAEALRDDPKDEIGRTELQALLVHCWDKNTRRDWPKLQLLLAGSQIRNGTWPRAQFTRQGKLIRNHLVVGKPAVLKAA